MIYAAMMDPNHRNLLEDVEIVAKLKIFAQQKNLDAGSKLYNDVLGRGLPKKNNYIGNSFINMFAKCGALQKARQVFDEICVRDVISWTALIAGYAEHGFEDQAFQYFDRMQDEGMSPNEVTFASMFKACGNLRAPEKGEEVHAEVVRKGLAAEGGRIGNALLNMYAKCGLFSKAQELFDELMFRELVSWNLLITGYSQDGDGDKAIYCFQRMQIESLFPNAVTYACVAKSCGSIEAVGKGKEIHAEITLKGLPGNDVVLGAALVDMYCRCGDFFMSRKVFDKLPVKNVVCWTSLIAGLAQHGYIEEAFRYFKKMTDEGLSPDSVMFLCLLKACAISGALEKGLEIHRLIEQKGLLPDDIALGNALVDMYAKCGIFAKAWQVLKSLQSRDVALWNSLIVGYIQHGYHNQALLCYDQMQNDGLIPDAVTFLCILKACRHIQTDVLGQEIHSEIIRMYSLENNNALATSVVDMYGNCGLLAKAQEVFDELKVQHISCWNTLIGGYVQHDQCEKALSCFDQMQNLQCTPDAITFLCILKACGIIKALDRGEQIHEEIIKEGLIKTNLSVGNALVDMYGKCGATTKAEQAFNELDIRDVVSWNSLLSGCTQKEQGWQAVSYFERMVSEAICPDSMTFACILKACSCIEAIEKGKRIHASIAVPLNDVVLSIALLDMYSRCGALEKAQQVFNELPVQSVASWTSLISGYTEQGHAEEALDAFEKMQHEALCPDTLTFICVLKACSRIGSIEKGEEIHAEIIRRGLLDSLLRTALVNMYSQCGALKKAEQVFGEALLRDSVSWNALITGYSKIGKHDSVFQLFNEMLENCILPDTVTFTVVLKVCCHVGLVNKGELYFEIMRRKYGIVPDGEHLTCMISMYSRVGEFDEAKSIIKKMPSSDHLPAWLALLGTCRKWGNVELGRFAFDQAVRLNDKSPVAYIYMRDIYASADMQEDANKIETMRPGIKALNYV